MKLFRVVLAGVALAVLPAAAAAQIQHQPIGCVVAGRFPRFEANFTPDEALARARVVFRPAGGKHWYAVAMTREAGKLAGLLPKPKKSLESLDYYIEATDTAMASTRTPDQVARVAAGAGACSNAPVTSAVALAKVTLEVPAGAPSVPPGFSANGIVPSTAGAAGAAAGATAGTAAVGAAAGGGIGAGVIIGAGAVVAGGAALAATAGGGDEGGDDEQPNEPPPAPTTLGLSVSPSQFDQFPVTLQFQGQSVTASEANPVWLEVPMPAPGTYQFTVTPSRAGEVNIGLRDNSPTGGVGVQPASITPTAPVTRVTPNCGRTMQATGTFTVSFVVAQGATCH